jgi:putative transcriptional regulator
MHINKYLLRATGALTMHRKKDFISNLLPIVSLSIIIILLSAYFAISNVNSPVFSEHAVSVSYLTHEAPPSLRNFHRYEDESLSAGKFLVASEKLKDPHFGRTVILLVNYSALGATGLIINRPTETTLHRVLPNIKGLEKMPDHLYFGGPVAISRITMIIQSSSKPEESDKVFDDIYISNSLTLLKQLIENRKADQKFRLYAGYAGWGPGQLESEIARNDWRILKGNPDILFDRAPDEIWQRLVPQNMNI